MAVRVDHPLQRDGVEEHHVEQEIERGDEDRANGQGQRQRALGLAQLLGNIRGGVPTAISDVDPEQADDELCRQRGGSGARGGHRQVRPVAMADGEAEDDEADHHDDFDRGQRVLHAGDELDAE